MNVSELHVVRGGMPVAVTPGASPYEHVADRAGSMLVVGGTVSLVEIGRAGSYFDCGVVAGPITLAPYDSVRVTYTVAPTMTFLPL